MGRLLGVLLLAGGGLWIGLRRAEELRRRAGELESWAGAMALLEGELSFRLPGLPNLLEDLSRRCPGRVGQTLSAVAAALPRLGEESFEEIWRQTLAEGADSLTEEDLEPLFRLGGILGRWGWEEQGAAAERARLALEDRASHIRGEWREKGRTYGVLGLSLGMLTAILLL